VAELKTRITFKDALEDDTVVQSLVHGERILVDTWTIQDSGLSHGDEIVALCGKTTAISAETTAITGDFLDVAEICKSGQFYWKVNILCRFSDLWTMHFSPPRGAEERVFEYTVTEKVNSFNASKWKLNLTEIWRQDPVLPLTTHTATLYTSAFGRRLVEKVIWMLKHGMRGQLMGWNLILKQCARV